MKETTFKPALWHNSLHNLQVATGHIKSNVNEGDAGDALLGLLTFKNGRSLELEIPCGTLIDKKYIELGNGGRAFTGEYEDINSVFGFSQNGKWYVLKDIFVSGYTESMPGFPSEKISGNSLIVSNKPISDDPIVNTVKLELDGFTKWFRNFNITRKYEFNQDEKGNYSGCKRIIHEYEPPDSCILYQNDEVTITVEQTGTEAGGPAINPEAALSVTSRLHINFLNPIALTEVIEKQVCDLRELISLLSGVYCSVETIQAHYKNEGIKLEYFAPFIKREREITNSEVMNMPFPFPKIENNVSEIIEKWFNLCPDAANAATILVSRLDESIMSCDLIFIACASAFEALSRVETNQEQFEKSRFDACFKNASEYIEDTDFREWLKNVVFNRRSANSLAKELLDKLEPFASYLLPNRKRFLYDHRICRNAYVHREGLESNKVLKDNKLYVHTKAVWLLSYVAILNLLGIDPEESLETLKESGYQSGIISQIRKQYSKANKG